MVRLSLIRAVQLIGLTLAFSWNGVGRCQLSPTGSHYAGRVSDTGGVPGSVGETGSIGIAVPLEFPSEKSGISIPLQVAHSGDSTMGAAGVGWNIPLSFISDQASLARHRPELNSDGSLAPRKHVQLTLQGEVFDLLPNGGEWVVQQGTKQLIVRKVGQSWQLVDGKGFVYTFEQTPQLANTGLWPLTQIASQHGLLKVSYAIASYAVSGGTATELSLSQIDYNIHPTGQCFKHSLQVIYRQPGSSPLSLRPTGGDVLVREQYVSAIVVQARADCTSDPVEIRRYSFKYAADSDTWLPRLASVSMTGRQLTPTLQSGLPIADYHYGSATVARALNYVKTQDLPLPQEAAEEIASTNTDGSIAVPTAGDKQATWQALVDFTGDGRPDLTFRKNGKLWLALGQPRAGGASGLGVGVNGNPAVIPMSDLNLANGPIAKFSSTKRRFWYGDQAPTFLTTESFKETQVAANSNVVDTWRQFVDVNGDGRVDLIDASEQPNRWVIYINTPGGQGIVWKKQIASIKALVIKLTQAGHLLPGGYLPISRATTGGDIQVTTCWKWENGDWHWSAHGWTIGRCSGEPNRIIDRQPEKTVVEWQLTDANGDGYPDFVFDNLPTRHLLIRPDPRADSREDEWHSGNVAVKFSPSAQNTISIAYNFGGIRAVEGDEIFAPPAVTNAVGGEFGTGRWETGEVSDGYLVENGIAVPSNQQWQVAAFVDVNGDGLVDRVAGTRAYLGVFRDQGQSFSHVYIDLPGPLSVTRSAQRATCTEQNGQEFDVLQTAGLRDLTGDGIPDYYDRGYVWIGTGVGFANRVPINGHHFFFSDQRERCDGTQSRTLRGLFDVDGDGKPDVLTLGSHSIEVWQLSSGDNPRNADAGRLTSVENGYGALTKLTYRSAKEDTSTSHQVYFPEIVVTGIDVTNGTQAHLGSTRFAFGYANLIFDASADAFRFPGYGRIVTLPLQETTSGRTLSGMGSMTVNWAATPFSQTSTKLERWLQQHRVGLVQDIYKLQGGLSPDPWPLLGIDGTDVRVIGATHFEWGARLLQSVSGNVGSLRECLDVSLPYDVLGSIGGPSLNRINNCQDHGFLYGASEQSWFGARAPPSASNIQTGSSVKEIDDYGRVTFAQYQRDLARNDDDVCIENRFAAPVGISKIRIALASRRVLDCTRGTVLASESWNYDGLAPNLLSSGLVTSHIIDRRMSDTGELIRSFKTFDASYDATGALIQTVTQRNGALRTLSLHYDDFGLVADRFTLAATLVPTTLDAATYDPLTLEILTTTDLNNVKTRYQRDEFGRVVATYQTLPNQPEVQLARFRYEGYNLNSTVPRRIVTEDMAAEPISATSDAPHRMTQAVFLDPLGRISRVERSLGQDYSDDWIVSNDSRYDMLGRLVFLADPYPKSTGSSYGTTYRYKLSGDLECAIRGAGVQPLSRITDEQAQRFPTCFDRYFQDHHQVLDRYDADALSPTSPQSGVIHRSVISATGRSIEQATLVGNNRMEFADFSYDRLGNITGLNRYRDPQGSQAVHWGWRLDTLGSVLELSEPGLATRHFDTSDWGEMASVSWTEAGAESRLERTYDALGRLTAIRERVGGVAIPEAAQDYAYDEPASWPTLMTPTFTQGRLSSIKSPNGLIALSYDALGQTTSEIFSDGQNEVLQEFAARRDGRLVKFALTAPGQIIGTETAKYSYDSAWRLHDVAFDGSGQSSVLFNADKIDTLGHLIRATYPGGTSYVASYEVGGSHRLREARVTSSSGEHRVLMLREDAVGRELSRREILTGAPDKKTNYRYDALGRLSSASVTTGTAPATNWMFDYDPLGNLTRSSGGPPSENFDAVMDATDPDRLCSVQFGGGPAPVGCNVRYNSLGAVMEQPTVNGVRAFQYFADGSPKTIRDSQTEIAFKYGGFGQLESEETHQLATTTSRSVRHYGPLFERQIVTQGSSPSSTYVSAVPDTNAQLISKDSTASWLFNFAELRGTRDFVDEAGRWSLSVDYSPFGATIHQTGYPVQAGTHFLWNGGNELGEVGLSYLGARLYDPTLGRFLSRDPALMVGGSIAANPYAFARNDPVNGSDPTGRDCHDEVCQPLTPIFPIGGGGNISSGLNGNGGGQSAQSAPPVLAGPKTYLGAVTKLMAEAHYGVDWGPNFNWDTFAQGFTKPDQAIEYLAYTQSVIQSIRKYNAHVDEYNARCDTIASLCAGAGDGLIKEVFHVELRPFRQTMGISSGDADPLAYAAGRPIGREFGKYVKPPEETVAEHLHSLGDDDLPVMRFSRRETPDLATNIEQALRSGKPDILTYNGGGSVRDQNRYAALNDPPIPNITRPNRNGYRETRDEYPFASTIEGGTDSFIGHVPAWEQSVQGAIISIFVRNNHLRAGDRFRVVIVD